MSASTVKRRARRDAHARVVVGANTFRKVCAFGIGLAAMVAVLQFVI